MKSLEKIKAQLKGGHFEFTRHAFIKAIERNISEKEIKESSITIEIIENYPDDKYSPSCLLLGLTLDNRVLHLQVSRVKSNMLKIITIYEPDPNQWINNRIRRK